MYIHFVPFFNANSTIMFIWWLDWHVSEICRINSYSYTTCIIFNADSTVISVWQSLESGLWSPLNLGKVYAWHIWVLNFIHLYTYTYVLYDIFVLEGNGPFLCMAGISPIFYLFHLHMYIISVVSTSLGLFCNLKMTCHYVLWLLGVERGPIDCWGYKSM